MAKAVIQGKVGLNTKGVDTKLAGLRQRSMGFASRFGGVGGRMGSSFAQGFAKFGKAGVVAAIGVAVVVGIALVAKAGIKAYAQVERLTMQFKVLFKDMGKAVAHVKDLRDFASSTPFQLAGISKASRLLFNFSEGALGGRESLTLFGDAAAATSNKIEDVSMWAGRMYGAIKGGRPFGEASARLQEMGVMTATTRNKMEAMSKSGASGAEIWDVLTASMAEYKGGMADLATTIDGKSSTISDSWANMMASIGEIFAPVWKKIQDMVIGTLTSITKAIDKMAMFAKTMKHWREEFGRSWAEAKAMAGSDMAERKKDKMVMDTDVGEGAVDEKKVKAAEKAKADAKKVLEDAEKAKVQSLQERMRTGTSLSRIGAGGMRGGDPVLKAQLSEARKTNSELARHDDRLAAIERNTKVGGLI